MPTWQELVTDKRKRQQASIPSEWLITPPPEDRLDVTDVPKGCGLLTPFELEITETTDVGVILSKLASAQWSSIDVTRAYYKRAIIAQQVVSSMVSISIHCHVNPVELKDKLFNGNIRRKGISSRR